MKMQNDRSNIQLELGLAARRVTQSTRLPRSRRQRTRWWFDRMRQVVELAVDWAPYPQGRPEQIWFQQGTGSAPIGKV